MNTQIKKEWMVLLWILVASIFLALPGNAQTDTTSDKVYIKIEILGLACPYCAYGMEKDLLKVAGVDKVDIELKEGLAFISTPVSQRPSKETLKNVILDGGFTPGEIIYSDQPFDSPKKNKKE